MAARQKAVKSPLPFPRHVRPTWEKDFRQIVGMDDFKTKTYNAGTLQFAEVIDKLSD